MIKIDPIGYENFSVSCVSDEECGLESVIAISNTNKKPLVEIKFEEFNSKNQQIDGGYKICEVNSNPGFEGMENFTKKNIAGEIVSFIKLKLG